MASGAWIGQGRPGLSSLPIHSRSSTCPSEPRISHRPSEHPVTARQRLTRCFLSVSTSDTSRPRHRVPFTPSYAFSHRSPTFTHAAHLSINPQPAPSMGRRAREKHSNPFCVLCALRPGRSSGSVAGTRTSLVFLHTRSMPGVPAGLQAGNHGMTSVGNAAWMLCAQLDREKTRSPRTCLAQEAKVLERT